MYPNSLESVLKIGSFQSCYKPIARLVKRLVEEAPIDPNWYSSEYRFNKLLKELKEEIKDYPDGFYNHLFQWFISDYLDLNEFIKTGNLESFEKNIPILLENIITPKCVELLSAIIMHWYMTSIKLPANCYANVKYEIAMFRTMLIFNEVSGAIFLESRVPTDFPTKVTVNIGTNEPTE